LCAPQQKSSNQVSSLVKDTIISQLKEP